MMDVFPQLPNGSLGAFRIERHKVKGENITYPVLFEGTRVWMSITQDEVRSHAVALQVARGRVLTSGLGLGYYVARIAERQEVTAIDIVERSAEVAKLVYPHVRSRKTNLHVQDIFDFQPGGKYDAIFIDIIAEYSAEDLVHTVAPLRHRLRRYLLPGGDLIFWQEDYMREQLHRELSHYRDYLEFAQAIRGGEPRTPRVHPLFGPWERWFFAKHRLPSEVKAAARRYTRSYGSAGWARQWHPLPEETPWLFV